MWKYLIFFPSLDCLLCSTSMSNFTRDGKNILFLWNFLFFPYQVLQLICTELPGWWTTPAWTHGHMLTGTHWPCSSCARPAGHWQPGTQLWAPESIWQLQFCCRSVHEPPHGWPHSWYTWPPEHCIAVWR